MSPYTPVELSVTTRYGPLYGAGVAEPAPDGADGGAGEGDSSLGTSGVPTCAGAGGASVRWSAPGGGARLHPATSARPPRTPSHARARRARGRGHRGGRER